MTKRWLVFSVDEADLLTEALESLIDEPRRFPLDLTGLLVAAAEIAGERRFLR